MDNAVKAMYIAAGTIIALMVFSVLVYMFRNGARLGQTYEQTQITAQVVKFNGQFDAYTKVTSQQGSDYGYAFIEKGNTASDVITCANLAFSVNEANDYDERNSLTVEVRCGSDSYYVYPIKNQPKNKFIKNKSFDAVKSQTDFNDSETEDFYDFLKEYNNVKIVDIASANYNSTAETIYEYYFDVDPEVDGNLQQNDVTGKVNKIVFTRTNKISPFFD